MAAISTTLLAFGIGVAGFFGDWETTVITVAAIIVIGLAALVAGIFIRYRSPWWASLLMVGGDIAVPFVIAASLIAVAAGGLHVADASPDTARTGVRTLGILVAGLVTLWVAKLRDKTVIFAGRAVVKQALHQDLRVVHFPEMPSETEGLDAYRAVKRAYEEVPATRWDFGFRRKLLEVVRDAIDADSYAGGGNWTGPP